nr:MAG TPA: hypothetical protein [Caudoviricetes sp.]
MRVVGMEHKPTKKVETPKKEEIKETKKVEKTEEPKKTFRKED